MYITLNKAVQHTKGVFVYVSLPHLILPRKLAFNLFPFCEKLDCELWRVVSMKFIFDLFHIFVVCVVVMVACRESLCVPHFRRL